jgi:hypothetical protein
MEQSPRVPHPVTAYKIGGTGDTRQVLDHDGNVVGTVHRCCTTVEKLDIRGSSVRYSKRKAVAWSARLPDGRTLCWHSKDGKGRDQPVLFRALSRWASPNLWTGCRPVLNPKGRGYV